MDPRLQRIIARRQFGLVNEATATSQPDEVPVIARVTSRSGWEALSEVRAPCAIGERDQEDRTTIVTGRIPAARIEAVRGMSFVKSLKAAQPVHPALSVGVDETGARPDLLPAGTLSNGAADVVVGIIDYGCDFDHGNFKTAAGKTRLLSIWHQGGQKIAGGSVAYGREYSSTEINAAITQLDPYLALGYGPRKDTPHSKGTHGTHVMDIAAGNGAGSGMAGFAPNADLIFVDVSHADLAFDGPEVLNSRFGDSVMLMEAITYIFDKAGGRPCVINISLGTNGGPHDGTTLVEIGIDRMITSDPNRAVTIAASNSFDDGIHAAGIVSNGGTVDLTWRIPFNDVSHNELEIWYPAADRITLELIAPDGTSIGSIAPGNNGQLVNNNGEVVIFAANRTQDPNNGDNNIGVFFESSVISGNWTVRLHGTQIQDGDFHAWIERDNYRSSSFAPPHDNSHTIGSISCGRKSIVVGSYDAHKPQQPISWFSSAGPTRDGRSKPEISAPGHGVEAAHSRTGTGVIPKSGTSMAAPAAAGIVALMMGEARARGADLSIEQIRELLTDTARQNPPDGGRDWNYRYGFGRVDASVAIAGVMRLAGGEEVLVTSAAPKTAKKKATKKRRG